MYPSKYWNPEDEEDDDDIFGDDDDDCRWEGFDQEF